VSTGTVPADKAVRLRATMESFFPEAMVTGYAPLIAAMQNDIKDRHVVAAAVKAGAQVIITANLKDFTPPARRHRGPVARRVPATCSTSILRASPICSASRPSLCRTHP
jgi:hypothetical protein